MAVFKQVDARLESISNKEYINCNMNAVRLTQCFLGGGLQHFVFTHLTVHNEW